MDCSWDSSSLCPKRPLSVMGYVCRVEMVKGLSLEHFEITQSPQIVTVNPVSLGPKPPTQHELEFVNKAHDFLRCWEGSKLMS